MNNSETVLILTELMPLIPLQNPDLPDVDKEVRRLLEQDAQAVSVKYDVIYESKSPVGRGETQDDSSLLLEEETNNEDNKMMEFSRLLDIDLLALKLSV